MLDHSARVLRASLITSVFLMALPASSAAATEARQDAQGIDRNDFAAILDMANGYGEAELTKTESGDPVITGDINGTAYQLFFLDCHANRDCRTLNFYAVWDGAGVPLELLNRWNAMGAFNKAYLTEGGMPVVELNDSTIDLTRGRLGDLFDRWTVTLAEFPREVLDKAAQ
ncbi:YbjN domain-containing protein [Jiella mangrovi]|uniref:YbjN domain-containing protein n=1 Tax=Jiella mangrovi TaxID=2821407 RepID=A0ABS4BJK8_9HYPH|nr:YbjN domain-containing protein [Jiella mangrovi]MBP0616953.1 YbjN domain-containing protein [Jiella mangrovi]